MNGGGKKLFIIGAGASNGAAFVHPKYKPPLTSDLHRIFDSCSLNNSPDGQYVKSWFADLLRLTKTENDIEEFFTIFFSLEIVSKQINPNFEFLSKTQIEYLLSNPSSLSQFFQEHEIETIKIILEYFLRDQKAEKLANPVNLKNLFSGCLCQYLTVISITNPNCIFHSLLFSKLTPEDAVVSFNYDLICDFTLYGLGKLNKSSFEGLGFADITIFNNEDMSGGTKLLHIHGSCNWWNIYGNGKLLSVTYYILPNEHYKYQQIGKTQFPIILPFKQKKILYDTNSIYKYHVDMFLKMVEESSIIYIVGKTFDNSDSELNSLILERSKKIHKKLYLINHHFEDYEFRVFHENLFNATYVQGWADLKQYYEVNKN